MAVFSQVCRSSKPSVEPLEGRRFFSTAATRRVFLTGNSLTDGVDYGAFEQLLGLDGSSVALGRQTGPGFQQSANYDLNPGYVTGGVKPGDPNDGNPWGDYQKAFAAATWDDLTLQPHERGLTSDVYNGENQAEVPVSLKFMEALAKHSPGAQVFIYSRPARRTDVTDDLKPTGDAFDYSAQWLRAYQDKQKTDPAFYSRSFEQQLMPLLRSAQAADKATAKMPAVKLIPVGEAYYNIDQDIKAGKFAGTAVSSILNFYSDQSHPTGLGSYLIGLSFYAAMTGRDPRGVAPTSDYLHNDSRLVDPKIQTLIQQAVYDAMTSPVDSAYTTKLTGSTVKSPPGTIRVTAFADANANGKLDPGEAGLRDVEVYLDTNNNGRLDAKEPKAYTHTDGRAVFSSVTAGTYVARAMTPAGYDVSAALPALADVAAGTTRALVLGLAPPNAARIVGRGTSTIRGSVVNDANHNAIWDAGEGAQSGHVVWLDLNDNGVRESYEPSATTNAFGKYAFADIPAGVYDVRQVVPAGHVQTLPAAGLAAEIDVRAGQTRVANLLLHRGTPPAGTAAIRGSVINDANRNGRVDPGETGLAGRTVYVDLNDDGIEEKAEPASTTAANGAFLLSGLAAGSYVVREILPNGSVYTGAAASAALQVTLDAGQIETGLTITNATA